VLDEFETLGHAPLPVEGPANDNQFLTSLS
jgi:hypothetical protein